MCGNCAKKRKKKKEARVEVAKKENARVRVWRHGPELGHKRAPDI